MDRFRLNHVVILRLNTPCYGIMFDINPSIDLLHYYAHKISDVVVIALSKQPLRQKSVRNLLIDRLRFYNFFLLNNKRNCYSVDSACRLVFPVCFSLLICQ
jgi:hypothetical protein